MRSLPIRHSNYYKKKFYIFFCTTYKKYAKPNKNLKREN